MVTTCNTFLSTQNTLLCESTDFHNVDVEDFWSSAMLGLVRP